MAAFARLLVGRFPQLALNRRSVLSHQMLTVGATDGRCVSSWKANCLNVATSMKTFNTVRL